MNVQKCELYYKDNIYFLISHVSKFNSSIGLKIGTILLDKKSGKTARVKGNSCYYNNGYHFKILASSSPFHLVPVLPCSFLESITKEDIGNEYNLIIGDNENLHITKYKDMKDFKNISELLKDNIIDGTIFEDIDSNRYLYKDGSLWLRNTSYTSRLNLEDSFKLKLKKIFNFPNSVIHIKNKGEEYYISDFSIIYPFDKNRSKDYPLLEDLNVLDSKEEAEAFLSLMQLRRLRNEWIRIYKENNPEVSCEKMNTHSLNSILTFPSYDLKESFIKDPKIKELLKKVEVLF